MQNSVNIYRPTTLPIPPPPPLPSLNSKPMHNRCIQVAATVTETSSDITFINNDIRYLFPGALSNVVSYYKSIKPVMQEGPQCGIAALSMASQFFVNVCVGDIFEAAKKAQFSKQGEMFSAANISVLAAELLNCKASVLDDLFKNRSDILNNICNGWPVLIPYDADKNKHPCKNNGRNAHWALLCGICFSVSEEGTKDLKNCMVSNEIPYVYNLPLGENLKKLLNYSLKVCVYAYQGKSKYLALWDFHDLLESNNNLYELTNKYKKKDLIVPDNCLSELRDKAVLLTGMDYE